MLVTEALFTPSECTAIGALAALAPEVPASGAYDPGRLLDLPTRRGTARWLPHTTDTRWVYARLSQAVEAANLDVYGLSLTAIETAQVSDYGVGDAFAAHADFGFLHAARQLSATVQLSAPDDYEGGDVEFLTGEHTTEPDGASRARWAAVVGRADRRLGALTLFPAHLPHRVTPVTRGLRRSLVVWVQGVPLGAG